MADQLHKLMDEVVTSRELLVLLALRYGLGSLNGRTRALEQIARTLGIARESARQTELAALAELRAAYESGRQAARLRQLVLMGEMIEEAA